MNSLLKFPFYAKAALLFIGLYLFIYFLFIAQDILLPLIYASIAAVLVSPVVDFMVKKKINRTLSIIGVLLLTLFLIIGLIILLSTGANKFSDTLPELEIEIKGLMDHIITWISSTFNISKKNINIWILDAKMEMLHNWRTTVGNTLTSVGSILATVLLTPVYIFMILLYQPHLVKFIHKVFDEDNNNQISEILTETKTILQSYIVGLFIEIVIVAVLNSVGLMLLGIEYAVILGILGGLLNVIPYLGGLITMAIFAVIALVTKSSEYALYSIGLYGFIQFVDNNYLVPKIVGSKVKLNALTSLIAVILGAAIWGIPGMFLFIPITAILKLVLDRVESLKPWGFLLGDTGSQPIKINLKKILRKNA
jgi:predicted PurR-regulated permease PerM